jgi:hypothetical protein
VLSVLASGIFPVFYAFAGFALRKDWWKAIVPLLIVHFALMFFLANRLPDRPLPSTMGAAELEALNYRLFLDALAIIIAVVLGYVCFLYVSITEFRRYFRLNAEIEPASKIHRVLVRAIDTRIGGFEFYGVSFASGQVGGDLIDLAGSAETRVAYVADVSGHGGAPGVVMGMVKSAGRMLLSSGADSDHLMARLNQVLYPLKKPDMFVTFCYVAKKGEQFHLGLAGHPAILQLCPRSNEVKKWERPNLPLGILPEGEFASCEAAVVPGDVFAL